MQQLAMGAIPQVQIPVHNPNSNHFVDHTGTNLTQMGNIAGAGVRIQFAWESVLTSDSDPNVPNRRVTRLKLSKQPIGDPATVATSYITPEDAARKYPAEWRYFNDTGEVPEIGTPLNELPGISQSQIGLMYAYGIRSVEDVVSAAEEVINRIGIEGRSVHNVAKSWVQNRDQAAPMIDAAQHQASIDQALEAERAKTKRLESELAAMRGELTALSRLSGTGNHASSFSEPIATNEAEDIDALPNPLADGDGELTELLSGE